MLLSLSNAEAKMKYPAPNPSTEFEKMAYPQVYPTYSWEPLANTEYYEVQVMKRDVLNETVVRDLMNTESLNRVTDWQPFNEAGNYYWRVRVVDKHKKPLSDWSAKKYFSVNAPVTFAVLGDSVSHGGANFIPAGQLACQWETYCNIPVKNIARSGDTTEMMLERFDDDVLPFSPKVLLIIGGVNDIRIGHSGDSVIKNLEAIATMCEANNIVPVFGTVTPMNEKLMRSLDIDLTDGDWRAERDKVNRWIMQNEYCVDVNAWIVDDNGELLAIYTPDGLHPDLHGKMLMGKTIENYLRENFTNLTEG